jgi:hypothetical protein
MKKAKNGKSNLQNLAQLIEKIDDDGYFKVIFKKTKGKNAALIKVIRQLLKSETIDTISEDQFIDFNSRSFTKLVGKTYLRLLKLVGDVWKSKENKQWQIDANSRIDEIEGLCDLGLNELAAVQLGNLEDHYFSNTDKIDRFYDDWVIVSRMVNLKFFLVSHTSNIFDVDEFDQLLDGLFMSGHNLRDKNLEDWRLLKSKAAYHQFIGDHLKRERKYNEFIATKKSELYLQEAQFRNTNMKQLLDITKWELALAHFKNGSFYEAKKIFRSGSENELNMPAVIVQQQLAQLFLYHQLENNNADDLELKEIAELKLYNSTLINNLSYRLEFNQLILKFLVYDYRVCISAIEDLIRKDDIVKKEKALYRDLLFLDVICKYLTGKRDFESQFRSLDKLSKPESFEHSARKLLMKCVKEPVNFDNKPFSVVFSYQFQELNMMAKNAEPMHALMISFLKDQFPADS